MKRSYLIPLVLIALSACGGNEPEETLSASEEQAYMESASDYAAASLPDTLPDDAPEGEPDAVIAAINRTVDYQAEGAAAKANAVYDNSGDMPVVRLKIDNQPEAVLKQTDALPEGAIYSNGNITWQTDGTTAELEQNGKTTRFTESQSATESASAASSQPASAPQ